MENGGLMQEPAEAIRKAREKMRLEGYRPVVDTDLSPCQKLVLVHTQVLARSAYAETPIGTDGTVEIELDEETPDGGDGKDTTFYYRCTFPASDDYSHVHLSELLRDEHVPEDSSEPIRYFVKE